MATKTILKSGVALALAAGLMTVGSISQAKASLLGSLGNPTDIASILVDNANLPSAGDVFASNNDEQYDDDAQADDHGQYSPIYTPVAPGDIVGTVGDVIAATDANVYPVDPTYVDGEDDGEENDGGYVSNSPHDVYANSNVQRNYSTLPRAIFGSVPNYGADSNYGRSVNRENASANQSDSSDEGQDSGGNDD